ncbi:hypothetical protein D5086_017614 [Populus alba]|uniref:Uncharacterized protein n=2 Tax=Populus TaxID=3689 RepID=A0ACC4BMH9_POPAL|nr:hypothetical protein NC653_022503 [Populus alba x Populus x berolinensis]
MQPKLVEQSSRSLSVHRYLQLSRSRKLVQLNSLLVSGKVFLVQCFNSRPALLIHLTLILAQLRSFSLLTTLFKYDSLTHYRVEGLVHFQYRVDAQEPALAISAFVSASAGTVSIPTTLFAAGIDDNILAKAIKTGVATILASRSGLAPTP